MGDQLWTGKPPRRKTRHRGLLSLSHRSMGRQHQHLAKAEGVNRHITWCTSPYPWSRSVVLVSGCGLGDGDQRRLTESGRPNAAESSSRWYSYKSTLFYITLPIAYVAQVRADEGLILLASSWLFVPVFLFVCLSVCNGVFVCLLVIYGWAENGYSCRRVKHFQNMSAAVLRW